MKFTRLFPMLMVLAGTAAATSAFAGTNAWSFEGPEGGAVYAVAINPADPAVVVMGTARGVYRSADGAASWSLAEGPSFNGVQDIAFDPTNTNRVVGAAGYLYLSEDGGRTFLAMQGPAQKNDVARIAFASDGTLYAICYGGTAYKAASPFANWIPVKAYAWPIGGSLGFVTVDPNNPLTVYVGVDEVGVFRTINGGVSWDGPLTSSFADPSGTRYYSLAVDPTQSTRVIVGSSAGIHISMNRGDAWTRADSYPTSWVGFSPGAPAEVTAIRTGGEVMRSIDRGATWPTSVADLQSIGLPRANYFPGSSNHLLVTSDHGLAESIQNGNDFDFRNIGVRTAPVTRLIPGGTQIYAAMNAGFGSIYRRNLQAGYSTTLSVQGTNYISGARNISSLAASASNYNTVFAVNLGYQLIRTFNGGGSWTAPHPAFDPGSTGDYITDVKIAPSDDTVAYVGRTITGLWKTTNGGTTFGPLANSPPHIGSIGVHPTNKNVVYVSGGTVDDTGIYKTTDGGLSWQQQIAPATSAPGYPYGLSVTGFYFDPANPNIVYATAVGGVRKTVDGGNTWTLVNFGFSPSTGVSAVAMLIDPAIPTTMTMVGTFDVPGFLRTVDGGATWDPTLLEVPGPLTVPQNAVLSANGEIVIGTNSVGIMEYTVAPDLSLSMSGLAATLPRSGSVTANFTIRNLGPHASSSSELTVGLPFFMTPTVPANCTFASQILRCTGGVLRVGQSRVWSVPLFVGTGSTQGGLSASVLGHEGDAVLTNNTLTFNFDTEEQADLDVSITSGSQSVDRGDATRVTVSAKNSGPSPSSNTQLSVQLPANLTIENLVAGSTSCVSSASTIDCSLGTLAPNTTVNLSFDARAGSPGSGAINAAVQGSGTDPDSDHMASRAITVRPVSDVSVSLSESADPVALGESFQYVATVRNNGADDGDVQLMVAITGAAVTGVNPMGGTCTTANNLVTCTLSPTMPPLMGTATVTIDVKGGDAAGIVIANASATFAGTDPVSDNDTASIGTTIRVAGDISVGITDNVDPATVDAPFNYIVTTHNDGPNAGSVQVTIPVTGAIVTGASSSGATCTAAAYVVTCSIGSLASGASNVINVAVTAPFPGTASATATATFGGVDPDSANNGASTSTTVRLAGDVGIEIGDSVDPATVDIPFTYIVTTRNDGPNAGFVQVVIPVTGATVIGASSSGATCTQAANTVTCNIASLANGASNVINVTVTAAAAGTASATATATFGGADTSPVNNSATASTNVRLVSDIGVEISDSVDPATAGASFDYVVTTRNTGPNASTVHVVIPVTNAVVSGATSAGATCTHTASAATCDVASLASGATHVITVTVAAAATGTASATATATATNGSVDLNPTNNSGTASTTVGLAGDLSVTVAESVDPATTGTAYSYTVTVRNGGPNAGAVHLSVPVTGATVGSAVITAGTCTNTTAQVSCDIGSLASNATATVTINVSAATAGVASVTATATFAGSDPDDTNNAATASTTVNAPASPPPSGGGGGGGGSGGGGSGGGGGGGGRFDWMAVGLLGLLVAGRRRISAPARGA
ncbi:MAG TPA: hypothetical protein VJP84_07225 [Steroidobacteraceae bacterium]|nr:hypothetical protein [Steroidobacteraceae bacterium]